MFGEKRGYREPAFDCVGAVKRYTFGEKRGYREPAEATKTRGGY